MDPDVNELEALSALVESDGWQLFLQQVEAAHGAQACVQQIDQALSGVDRGDRDAADETVTQIRARAKAAQALTRWPAERIKALKAKKDKGWALGGRRRA